MHTHSSGRRALVAIAVLLVAASCCATALSARAGLRPILPGTWSGSYSGAFTGTFTLHWRLTGSRLIGRIKLSSPPGSYGITGSVRGSAIHFGVVGAGAVYTGSVSGTSMSGKYRTPQGGGSWSASKSS